MLVFWLDNLMGWVWVEVSVSKLAFVKGSQLVEQMD